MLESSSYYFALSVVATTAIVALIWMRGWLRALGLGRFWVGLLCWWGAALLLTPAYATSSAETFAPAIIVAIFQLALHDLPSAMHAIRPLMATLTAATLVAVIQGALTYFARRRKRSQESSV